MRTSRQYPMKALHTQRLMNTCPALLGRKDVSTGVALRQRVEQRLGFLEVSRIKALGEPAIDRRKQLVGLSAFPLLLPQAGEAQSGPQLPGFGLLVAGNGKSLLETGFRLLLVGWRLLQQQLALEPVYLGLVLTLPLVVDHTQRL